MRESTASPPSTTSSTPPNSRQRSRLPLSCRECQRKKVKCDRSYPCGQCSRAGHSCTPSTRKPRAKVGSRAVDIELRNRIAKLEKLVETFQGDDVRSEVPTTPATGGTASDAPGQAAQLPPGTSTVAFTGLSVPEADEPATAISNKHPASSFLNTLSTEVQALKEAFEQDDEDEDYDALSSEPTPPQAAHPYDPSNPSSASYELLLCPPGALFVMPGVVNEPGAAMFAELCNAYLVYMEAFHKLFHLPTLEAFLYQGEQYLGNDADAPCNKALKAAICFAGVVALREDEAQAKFGKRRDKLVVEYRRMVDVAIYQADPMNTTDIAALQALVLYISAIRILDPSRRAWTLLGLVTRIARALNVHREAPGEPIYLRELRRRLWHNIIYIDCYSALDRGSEPAIDAATLERPLPTDCNDTDFGEASTSLHARTGEITDMSFSLVTLEASVMMLRMAAPDLRERCAACSHPNPSTPAHATTTTSSSTSATAPQQRPIWQVRLDLANAFSRSIDARTLRFCDPAIPHQRLLIAIGKAAAHSMVLRAVRPLEPHFASAQAPPRVSTLWTLQLAVVFLRQCTELYEDPQMADIWRRMPWVPWHALAVALAGLCTVRGSALAEEAWALVDATMPRHAGEVADSRTGMLWKPIEKLRRKAAAFRDEGAQPQGRLQLAPVQSLQQQQQQKGYQLLPELQQPGPALPLLQQQQQQQQPPPLQQHEQSGLLQATDWIPSGGAMPGSLPLPGVTGADAAKAATAVMQAPPPSIANNMAESSFLDFPPDMLSTIPDEGSWLDWEAIMQDMEEINKGEEMQLG